MATIKEIITPERLCEMLEIRSEPHIYAFFTDEVGDAIKVGDTFRPIETRLNEWRKTYTPLTRLFPDSSNEKEGLSKVNEEIYFRDHSLHRFLEEQAGGLRLTSHDFGDGVYYSNEFFKHITLDDVKRGIEEIKRGYEEQDPRYQYYKMQDRSAQEQHWKNDKKWELREK